MQPFTFKTPCSIVLSGASGTGKTCFTQRIIDHRARLFSQPIREIKYVYVYRQSWMPKYSKIVDFVKEIPKKLKPNTLLVIDDFGIDAKALQEIMGLFVRGLHHQQSTGIFITQNLFYSSAQHRTILLNAHYLVLFKTVRARYQLEILGRQLYGHKKQHDFVEAYEDATNASAYGYLLLNLTPNDNLRLRTHIFPNEEQIVYTIEDDDEEKK